MRTFNRPSALEAGCLMWCLCFVLVAATASQPVPDFIRGHIEITPNPLQESLSGEVTYELSAPAVLDSIVLDAHNMEYRKVALDGAAVAYAESNGKLVVRGPVPPGQHILEISYNAHPRQALYFFGWKDSLQGNEQIWTQGQGKNSSHWVPVVDRMEEKAEFDLSIRFDPDFEVIANGVLTNKSMEGDMSLWDFDMSHPMSSYLLAFAIGRYEYLEESTSSKIPLKLYYPEGQGEKARWTYRYSREIFDFLEREIGVPYPWGDYKQVPVSDFLYAGMENTGATFFADRYLVDSLGFQDENYVNINAHELAHQWFGNLVTEQDASHHWLHEGFATYYAYRAEAEVMGEEAVYWKLYETAVALSALDEENKGESLTDPTSGSLTFYEKGAWAVFLLEAYIGREAFRKGIREFLTAYSYGNVTVDDFLGVVEKAGGKSLDAYREVWLDARTFPKEQALNFLRDKAPSVHTYLKFKEKYPPGMKPDFPSLRHAWEAHPVPGYREKLLDSFGEELTRPFLDSLFQKGSLPVQKSLLSNTGELQAWMFPYVKQWLDAPSYDLREAALFRLWVSDPLNREVYLSHTRENGSTANMGVQQLWWLLAAITEGGEALETRQSYLQQLRNTTGPGYSWEIRQNAFSMLYQVRALDKANIKDLIASTEHHSWQYRKFARDLFDTMLGEMEDPNALWELVNLFPRESYRYVYDKMEHL